MPSLFLIVTKSTFSNLTRLVKPMKPQSLDGITVLELGSTVAGPFCGRLLADFGANVIKVEPPEGDPVRTMGKRFNGTSLYASSIFRNKKLLSIDLRTQAGIDITRRLALKADILIENFRPGTMEKWGLGYEELKKENPGLIMVRISGFGQDGPYKDRAGYGVICEAMSGLRHLTGDVDRPPARVAVSMTDYITGLYAAFGAMNALMVRNRTGVGQCVDAALYECAFSFMEPWISAFDKLGHVANRCGSRLPESTPNNLYPTADGQHIHITAMADSIFSRLCVAMGRPDLPHNPLFNSATARGQNFESVDQCISEWTTLHKLDEVEKILQEQNVPALRIYTIEDIFRDPHYAARGSIQHIPDQVLGSVAMAQVVPRLSETPGHIDHAGEWVGSSTKSVLQSYLGMNEIELNMLQAQGVIFDQPEPSDVESQV